MHSFAAALVALLSLSALAAPSPAAPWDAPPLTAPAAEVARAAGALPPAKDAHVQVLLDERTFRFDAQGVETGEYRLVYRILSLDGARGWGGVETGWAPWYQERPVVQARVISPEGAEHRLDPATLVEGSEEDAPETYSDRRALRGPLPAVTVGSVVEELIVVKERPSLFSAGTAGWVSLGRNATVLRARVRFEYPRTLPLQAQARGITLAPRREEVDGKVRLTFEAGPLEHQKAEPYLPPELAGSARVVYSTGRDWASLAQRYHEVVEGQLNGAELAKTAAEVAGSETRPERVAARMMAWIHGRVRYTGLYFGDAAVVPRTPAEVLARRYGDCKDLATLLVGLLRARGIPASVALVRTGHGEVEPSMPGLGRFDHAIVRVHGTPGLWVDATDPYTPVGEVNPSVQGRLALVARPGTRALERIPEAPAAASTLRITRTVRLAEEGPARVAESTEATGAIGADYRAYFARNREQELREHFERYAHGPLKAQKLERMEMRNRDTLEAPVQLDLEASDSTLGQTTDTKAVADVNPWSVLGSMPDELLPGGDGEDEGDGSGKEEKSAGRKGELQLPEVFVRELTYRVVAPEGYALEALPEATRTVPMGPATLTMRFERKGEEVVASYRFDAGKRRYSAAEVEAFRAAARAFGEEPAPQLAYEHRGATLITEGKVREGLRAFREAAERHPKEALHAMQLARALLKVGMGDDARAAARLGVKLEPTSARAHQALGWTLQHDALGRLRHPGFDLPGAVAAYQKAKELDPKHFETRGDLAILLEHTPDGERYGEGARLEDAAREYQALRKDLEREELDPNLMTVLFQLGRYREVLQVAEKAPEGDLRDELRLAAAALADGPEAAVRQAARWVPDAAKRRTRLEAAYGRVVVLRRYPEALALLRAVARGNPDAQLETRLQVMTRVRPLEPAELRGDDPREVVKRVLLTVASEKPGDVKPLFSRRSAVRTIAAYEKAFVLGMARTAREVKRASGLPMRVAVEIGLQVSELQMEGDARGTRVGVLAPTGQRETWFLVREEGAWRVLSTRGETATMGAEALRLLKQGDEEGARRWLNWARELLPSSPAPESEAAGFALGYSVGAQLTPAALELAAARLAAWGLEPASVVPVLEAARARATSDAERRGLGRDLLRAYNTLEREKDALALAEQMLAADPDDDVAFGMVALTHMRKNRPAEVLRLCEARLARHPDQAPTLALAASARALQGDVAGHQRTLRRVIELGKAESSTYNNLAWYALFTGEPVTDEALEHARLAASMGQYKQPSSLNTLATLYAETGRLAEARELLVKYLELAERTELEASDWYVYGRVAEGYGLTDTARAAYARVKSKEPNNGSADVLAKARLQSLDGAARTAGPATP